jgi:diguanylate cyclase (GGDEF)-like protein
MLQPRRSFNTRLSLITGGIALLVAILLSLVVDTIVRPQLSSMIGNSLEETAVQMTDMLDQGMYERYRDIQVLAGIRGIRDPEEPLTFKRSRLELLQQSFPYYAWIGLTDLHGNVIVSTQGLLEGEDVSQRPWFSGGLAGPYVGDVHKALLLEELLENSTGEPLRFVDVAAPVYDLNGELVGVLGAHLSWEWAREIEHSLLNSLQERGGIDIFVVSAEDELLLATPGFAPPSGGKLEFADDNHIHDGHGFHINRWFDDESYITGYAQTDGYREYPGLGWTVLVRQHTDAAFAPVRELRVFLLIAGALVGLLFTGFGLILSRRVSRPILAMADAAHRLHKGEEGVTFPRVPGGDELTLLSEVLGGLVTTLEKRHQELAALNDSLEVQVAGRTRELQSSLSLLEATYNATSEALLTVDLTGKIVSYNQQYVHLWKVPQEVIASQDDEALLKNALVQVWHPEAYLQRIREIQAEPDTISRDLTELIDGRLIERHSLPQRAGAQVVGRVWGFRDVTEVHRARETLEKRVEERTAELKQLNEQLQHDALHDALTGLANRALFINRLQHVIALEKRHAHCCFAVLFLDFDRFKVINDSLGHSAGNALLQQLAEQLKRVVRPSDTVARFGGDEFTLLLENISEVGEAIRVAERLQQVLQHPLLLDERQVHISASIGIVFSEGRYDRPEEVLQDADIAMYRVKEAGKGGYQVFDALMRERVQRMMTLEAELREAVEQKQFQVVYQPIMSVASGTVEGFEALVRWAHPVHKLISPADFIPVAEDTGLIIEIDRWVLREACRQLQHWNATRAGQAPLTVSVNLSAQQFMRTDLAAFVQAVLKETTLAPALLKLEITEGLLMNASDTVTSNLNELRDLGVRLHLDDFGTGYSSLSYLQRFRTHALKIDRAFVSNMASSPESLTLVRTIITMAHALGMEVVAEGVETSEQANQLRDLSCNYAQGYFFSKPLSVEATEALLTSGAGLGKHVPSPVVP